MTRVARVTALCVLVVGALGVASAPAPAAGSSRAVVNVGGRNRVITFNGSISGIGALQAAAGVETISYGGQGVAVCRINGVGNPPIPGECLGEVSGQYWSYWRAAPGAGGFSYSGGGAGGTSVTDGAVEGWSFGSGGPPPFSSFCAIVGCAPPPPPPTVAPTPAPTTPATVAASSESSSSSGHAAAASGTNDNGGKPGSRKASGTGSGGGDPNVSGNSGSASDSGSSGRNGSTDRGASRRHGQQAAGPDVSREGDGGSPWGVAAAAGAFAALGAGGYVVRKRRRSPMPPA